jgi:hypothetical protein
LQSISKLAGYFDQKISSVLFHVPFADISNEFTARIEKIIQENQGNILIKFLLLDPENKEVVKLSNPYLKTDLKGILSLIELEFINAYDIKTTILNSIVQYKKKMTATAESENIDENRADEY